ncbi:hypothetical protein BaRGS_00014722 [Batillaria attramentaria]|uniref:Uncharacterized protein n=1 Tax=Batillaria attramentaria TaxID=370345 RepID=A0ABD0L4M8_9CAEN
MFRKTCIQTGINRAKASIRQFTVLEILDIAPQQIVLNVLEPGHSDKLKLRTTEFRDKPKRRDQHAGNLPFPDGHVPGQQPPLHGHQPQPAGAVRLAPRWTELHHFSHQPPAIRHSLWRGHPHGQCWTQSSVQSNGGDTNWTKLLMNWEEGCHHLYARMDVEFWDRGKDALHFVPK